MPKAVVSLDTKKFDLKSLPEGFVELRPMSFGQVVQRRSLLKLSVVAGKNKSFQGEMAMMSEEVTRFEYRTCIVDHNLEDETGRKLNLASENDFRRLDPRVGSEIDQLISDMNNFDEDDQEN